MMVAMRALAMAAVMSMSAVAAVVAAMTPVLLVVMVVLSVAPVAEGGKSYKNDTKRLKKQHFPKSSNQKTKFVNQRAPLHKRQFPFVFFLCLCCLLWAH